MIQELRCDNSILFGIVDGGAIDVKCRSRRCGAEKGSVIIHRFDLGSGKLLATRKFKDPAIRKEGTRHASR